MFAATIAMPYQSAVPCTLLYSVVSASRTIAAFGTNIRFLVVGKRQAEPFCNVRFGIGIDEVEYVKDNPPFSFFGTILIAARVLSERFFLEPASVLGVSQKRQIYDTYNIYRIWARYERARRDAPKTHFFESASVT